jgi:hypothetical protein
MRAASPTTGPGASLAPELAAAPELGAGVAILDVARRSAPVQNPFVPVAVSTTQRTAGSPEASSSQLLS